MTLRVLQVVESLDPEPGSAVVSLTGAIGPLRARGIESLLAARCGDSIVVRSPDGDHRAAWRDVGGLLEKADVVHVHGWDYDLARGVARTASASGRPCVLSPHGSLCTGPNHRSTWRDRLRAFWDRRRIRRAAVVTALNALEERELREARLPGPVRLLPYGVSFAEYETERSAGADHGTQPPAIVMLGPLHPRWGCVALLKALAEMGADADGWNVVIAGCDSGAWRKMLEAAVRRKDGADRVRFVPAPDVSTQRKWLATASLVAAPSLRVSLCVSIMQGLAAGVPVLTTTCAAPPGLDGVIRVCGPRRTELREALRSVLTMSVDARRRFGEQARAAARATLDWSVLAERYAELYRGVM